VCLREFNCQRIGVHRGDAGGSRSGWLGQVALGHLDPACQPYKRGAWATRGPFGLSAASHWQFLPDCYEPEVLDVPLISARVAAKKYLARCDHDSLTGPRIPWLDEVVYIDLPRGPMATFAIRLGGRHWCPDGHRQQLRPSLIERATKRIAEKDAEMDAYLDGLAAKWEAEDAEDPNAWPPGAAVRRPVGVSTPDTEDLQLP
jgi:hypothetical protein